MSSSFANSILSGSLFFAIPVAIIAGFVSFASPCVLPLVPGYLSYSAGLSGTGEGKHRLRVFTGSALFVLGFTVVFVAYGALFGGLGRALSAHQAVISRVLGGLTIILGLIFAGAITQVRQWRPRMVTTWGLAGAPLLGLLFGLGWTPCIGPTLAAVQTLAFDQASQGRGALLSGAYCIGLGLPFMFVGFAMDRANTTMSLLKNHMRTITRVGGLMLIAIGILQVTGSWEHVIAWMRHFIVGFTPVV
ncbi:MAG TPA: cytochrome c biogenesis protein CcdA [Candidatus Nanopelagicaceae bacterium]|nr:cytochrome c biogenesis protein CcdA [Candidatus Nanopelagicaceae bacterium]